MRTLLLILSALLSLSVLAPLSASASVGDDTAVTIPFSDAPNDPACPDDCCEDCPDFTQCQMGCALAVLPDALTGTQPTRFTPDKAEAIAPHRSAKLPPATPPPRAGVPR